MSNTPQQEENTLSPAARVNQPILGGSHDSTIGFRPHGRDRILVSGTDQVQTRPDQYFE